MKTVKTALIVLLVCVSLMGCAVTDPLPSWNEGTAKESIIEFVEKTTSPGNPDFVQEADRIAGHVHYFPGPLPLCITRPPGYPISIPNGGLFTPDCRAYRSPDCLIHDRPVGDPGCLRHAERS
jgi:hypothetical protein